MRIGNYAIYKDREYKLGGHNDKTAILISRNPQSVRRGFEVEDEESRIYTKEVPVEDIEKAYSIQTYAIFHGFKLRVASFGKTVVSLFTRNRDIAKQLNMFSEGSSWYLDHVKQTDVYEFIEDIQPIYLQPVAQS